MGGHYLLKTLWREKSVFILYLYLLWMPWYFEKYPACVSWIDSILWRTRNNLTHLLLIKRKKRKKKEKKTNYWYKLNTNRDKASKFLNVQHYLRCKIIMHLWCITRFGTKHLKTVGQNAILISFNALEQLSEKRTSHYQFVWH